MDGRRLTVEEESGCTELFIYLFIYLLSCRPPPGPRLPASAPGSNIHLAWCIPGHWNFNVICGRIQMASSRINAARWQCWCQRPDAQQHPAITPPHLPPFISYTFHFLPLFFCSLSLTIAPSKLSLHTHTQTRAATLRISLFSLISMPCHG